MKLFHIHLSYLLYCVYFVYVVVSSPQQPEINDQYENVTAPHQIQSPPSALLIEKPVTEDNEVLPPKEAESRRTEVMPEQESLFKRILVVIAAPFIHFAATPKVNSVLRNIGTCIVNGAMEIVTHFFPAPLIPLIATAAGMVIPFEPVVMLREKMPVTSYRRAFRTALNSFLSTFDRYRLDDEDDDPYMTRRFNRRLMNDDVVEKNQEE